MRYALPLVFVSVLSGCFDSGESEPALPAADEATIAQAEAEVAALTAETNPPAPVVNGSDFGLIGDGITDNTQAFRALMSAGNQTVRISAGNYVTGNFSIAANTVVILESGTIIRDSGQLGENDRLINITSENVRIVGLGARVLADRRHYTTGEQRHGVYIFGARNVVIDGLESNGHGGDGFYIGGPRGKPSTDITLKACRSDNNRRQGLSITSARRVRVADCEFMNTNGTAPQAGIDLEPNNSKDVLDYIVLLRPQTSGNRGGGIVIALHRVQATSEPVDIIIIDHHSADEIPPLRTAEIGDVAGSIRYNLTR